MTRDVTLVAGGLSPLHMSAASNTPTSRPPAEAAARPSAASAAAPAREPFRERIHASGGRVPLLVFRIGGELYAGDLAAVEEAVDLPVLHPLPEMPERMLGTFELRQRMTTVYSPAAVLGTALELGGAAIVLRSEGRRVAVAVDDVDDVLTVEHGALRPAPALGTPDGIAVGVVMRHGDLVAVIDLEALVEACVQDHAREAV